MPEPLFPHYSCPRFMWYPMDLKYSSWADDAALREVSCWASSCICHPHHAPAAPSRSLPSPSCNPSAGPRRPLTLPTSRRPWLQAGHSPFGHLLPRGPLKTTPPTTAGGCDWLRSAPPMGSEVGASITSASTWRQEQDKGEADVKHAQDFLPTSNPFLLLPVSVVSTTQTHLVTHGSPRVLRANATHEAAVPAVQPYFSLTVTEKGRSFFVGDEQAVCPCLAQNVPPAALCHVCEQRWHSLPKAW